MHFRCYGRRCKDYAGQGTSKDIKTRRIKSSEFLGEERLAAFMFQVVCVAKFEKTDNQFSRSRGQEG